MEVPKKKRGDVPGDSVTRWLAWTSSKYSQGDEQLGGWILRRGLETSEPRGFLGCWLKMMKILVPFRTADLVILKLKPSKNPSLRMGSVILRPKKKMILSKSWISWNRDDPMISKFCGFQVVAKPKLEEADGNVIAVKTLKVSEKLL